VEGCDLRGAASYVSPLVFLVSILPLSTSILYFVNIYFFVQTQINNNVLRRDGAALGA
jgi:hypothetical protein